MHVLRERRGVGSGRPRSVRILKINLLNSHSKIPENRPWIPLPGKQNYVSDPLTWFRACSCIKNYIVMSCTYIRTSWHNFLYFKRPLKSVSWSFVFLSWFGILKFISRHKVTTFIFQRSSINSYLLTNYINNDKTEN